MTRDFVMPALNRLRADIFLVILALYIGTISFGLDFLLEELKPSFSFLMASASTVVVAPFACGLVFLFNYLRAPAAIWRRDRATISELHERLRPALQLFFDENECIRYLREGSITPAMDGTRWYGIKNSPRHIMIKCINTSEVTIMGVAVYVTNIRYRDCLSLEFSDRRFFEPARIKPISNGRQTDTIDIPPSRTTPRFFSVVTYVSIQDLPHLNSSDMPYEYNFLFRNQGVYEVTISVYSQETVASSIILEMMIKIDNRISSNNTPIKNYKIVWVRHRPKEEDQSVS